MANLRIRIQLQWQNIKWRFTQSNFSSSYFFTFSDKAQMRQPFDIPESVS